MAEAGRRWKALSPSDQVPYRDTASAESDLQRSFAHEQDIAVRGRPNVGSPRVGPFPVAPKPEAPPGSPEAAVADYQVDKQAMFFGQDFWLASTRKALGMGAYGKVVIAYQRQTGGKVAIKLFQD